MSDDLRAALVGLTDAAAMWRVALRESRSGSGQRERAINNLLDVAEDPALDELLPTADEMLGILASPPHREGPLDVERLAEALQTEWPDSLNEKGYYDPAWCRALAERLAAEYARLSRGAAEQEEGNG